MSIKCPHCGNDLPDVANYCLHCCKSLNDADDFVKSPTNKKKAHIFILPKVKPKRVIVISAISFLTILISFLAISKIRLIKPYAVEAETRLVTSPDGEAVTDENGENVYEVVEITTEKKGLFEQLFPSNDKTSENNKTDGTIKENQTEKDKNTDTTAAGEKLSVSETTSATNTTLQQPENTTTTTTTTTAETGSSDGLQWEEYNGKIKITGYTGNASTVIVPTYINGKRVSYLGEKAFANNSNITKIIFKGENNGDERLYFPYKTTVFYNLPNLTTLDLPYETSAYFIQNGSLIECKSGQESFYSLFKFCQKLSNINIAKNTTAKLDDKVFSSQDGVVFYYCSNNNPQYNYKTGNLVYYPPAKSNAAYIVPDDVYYILRNAFENNPYIKSITFGKGIKRLSDFGAVWNCENLTEYKISSNCTSGVKAINGVLYIPESVYCGSSTPTLERVYAFYPSGKRDMYFEFESFDKITIYAPSFGGNKYIETIKVPSELYFTSTVSITDCCPALKKVITKEGSNVKLSVEIEYI